ncbi:hypothetical protein CMI39_00250 [Candidatus Pacearchaeota archaeon]|nr:hypothetical protein [Candidatus Pacearchaeota archaeon]|tara:strand:+ start:1735 stop:5277 length:3543 start_codon:yes stop_codon:yes gene_type:complete
MAKNDAKQKKKSNPRLKIRRKFNLRKLLNLERIITVKNERDPENKSKKQSEYKELSLSNNIAGYINSLDQKNVREYTKKEEKLTPKLYRNKEILISHIEKFLEKEKPKVSLLEEHFNRTIPNPLISSIKFRDIKRDIGNFLAGVSYTNSDSDLLKEMISIRETELNLHKREEIGETYLYYVLSGGRSVNFRKISNLINKIPNKTNILGGGGLRTKKYFEDDIGFESFSKIVDLVLDINPTTDAEFNYTANLIKEIYNNYRFNVLQNKGFPKENKVNCNDLILFPKETFEKAFLRDFNILPTLNGVYKELFSESTYNLRAIEYSSKKLNTKLLKIPKEKRKSSLELFVETNKVRKIPFLEGIGNFLDEITNSPELLDSYKKAFERIKKINRIRFTRKLNPWEIYKKTKLEYAKLDPKKISDRDEIREAIIEKLPPNLIPLLIQSSYEGKLHTISKESLIGILNTIENTKLALNYKLGDNGDTSEIEFFHDNILDQIKSMKKYGEEKIFEIDDKLAQLSTEEIRNKFNTKLFSKSVYGSLREQVYSKLRVLNKNEELLIREKENYIIQFLDYLKNNLVISGNQANEIINLFFIKSSQLINNLKNSSQNIGLNYGKWFNHILDKRSLNDLTESIKFESLEHITSKTNIAKSTYHLKDSEGVLVKFASLIGKVPYSLYRTKGLEFNISFPNPRPEKLFLPEFINCLKNPKENKLIYKMFASLQAAFSRYKFFEQKENQDKTDNDLFNDFSNPDYAQNLWALINYARAKEKISDDFRGLTKEINITNLKIENLYKEALNIGEADCQGVLSGLEQVLVFEIKPKNEIMNYVQNKLVQHLKGISTKTNQDVMHLVRQFYDIINKKYKIPPKIKEQTKKIISLNPRDHIQTKTGALYLNEDIHFFKDIDSEESRLIVKHTRDIKNDRIEKIRTSNYKEINEMTRLLESIKPQRVTTEKRVDDGEIDEGAYNDMMLELKSGHSPDTNVFTNRRINEREVSVLLTINQSNKLGKWLDDKTRIIDYVRPAAIYLSEAAKILEDNFAVLGYTSQGRDEVFVNVFKSFNDIPSKELDYKLGLLAPLYSSRTGIAYRYFASVLGEQPSKRKIHFDIITELANDEKYSGEKAILDTKLGALAERSKGIELFGICLDKNAKIRDLEKIYGQGHFKIVKNYKYLPDSIINTYKTLTL